MCNLYSITTNQEAIRALFRVVNRYVGNLAPMPGVFPDYPHHLFAFTASYARPWAPPGPAPTTAAALPTQALTRGAALS
jgi:hypothetical protein